MSKNENIEKMLHEAGHRWRDGQEVSDDFTSSVMARIEAGEATGAPVIEVPSRSLSRRTILAVGMAAGFAIAGVFGWQMLRQEVVGKIEFLDDGLPKIGKQVDEVHANSLLNTDADGSSVALLDDERVILLLNSSTTVEVEKRDHVALHKGEIWVTVEDNSGYFAVETPNCTVSVHGTSFGVEIDGDQTNVLLASGKISLDSESGNTYLDPGTRAVVGADGGQPVLSTVSGELVPAWAWDAYGKMEAARSKRYFPSALGRSTEK